LDDLGLLAALVSHLGSYHRSTGILVEFEHRGIEHRRFGPDLETAAYRIVQEALTNIARHAGVHSAHLRVWSVEGLLCLRIEDQGVGFDAERLLRGSAVRGIGGMRERSALLGGTLTVESAPGQGCRLTAELPVADFAEWR
jgi:signal transduction histidine kinase